MTRGGTGCECEDCETCNCSFASSDCIAVQGDGSDADPFTFTPNFDPDINNMASCTVDGILVQLPDLIASPPRGAVRRTTSLAVASGVLTVVSFNAEIYDSAAMVDTVNFPGRVSVVEDGLYEVQVIVVWEEPVAAAFASCSVYSMPSDTNVATDARYITTAPGTPSPRLSITGEEELDASTYLELRVFQNTGSSLNLTGATLSARWVAPQV